MAIETEERSKKSVHLGKRVQRVREIIGIKQITLAERANMSQQNISKIEQSADISDETLEELARHLGVSTEFIKNFDEEKAIYNIQSNITYQDSASNNSQAYQFTYNNNPIDQIVELFEKLLQSEKEKVEILHSLSKQIEGLKVQRQE